MQNQSESDSYLSSPYFDKLGLPKQPITLQVCLEICKRAIGLQSQYHKLELGQRPIIEHIVPEDFPNEIFDILTSLYEDSPDAEQPLSIIKPVYPIDAKPNSLEIETNEPHEKQEPNTEVGKIYIPSRDGQLQEIWTNELFDLISKQVEFDSNAATLMQGSASQDLSLNRPEIRFNGSSLGAELANEKRILVIGGTGRPNSAMWNTCLNYVEGDGPLIISVTPKCLYEQNGEMNKKMIRSKNFPIVVDGLGIRIELFHMITSLFQQPHIAIAPGGSGTLAESLKLARINEISELNVPIYLGDKRLDPLLRLRAETRQLQSLTKTQNC